MVISRLMIGILIAALLYVAFAKLLKKFWIAPPPTPDKETIKEVNIKYECIVCGTEVIMTQTPDNIELEAPRHCKEDMVEVSPSQ